MALPNLIDSIDKNIEEIFDFSNTQKEHLKSAIGEQNNLKEYQVTLQNALKLIHGQDSPVVLNPEDFRGGSITSQNDLLAGNNRGYDDEDENLKFSPVSEGGSGNSLLSGANPNLRNSALGQMAVNNQVGISYIAGTINPGDML